MPIDVLGIVDSLEKNPEVYIAQIKDTRCPTGTRMSREETNREIKIFLSPTKTIIRKVYDDMDGLKKFIKEALPKDVSPIEKTVPYITVTVPPGADGDHYQNTFTAGMYKFEDTREDGWKATLKLYWYPIPEMASDASNHHLTSKKPIPIYQLKNYEQNSR